MGRRRKQQVTPAARSVAPSAASARGWWKTGWLALIVPAVALVGWWLQRDRPLELKLVFIGRYSVKTADTTAPGSERFERMHETSLRSLVNDFNDERQDVRLGLEVLDSGSNGALLAGLYEQLAGRQDVLAVIDNSWAKEIEKEKTRQAINALAFPVIFLNADKAGLDFGAARLFLGSGDSVLKEILTMLDDVLKVPEGQRQPKWAFVTEKDYKLTGKFQEAFGSRQPDATVQLNGIDTIPSRLELREARLALVEAFPEPKSADAKVILLNSHGAWGNSLLEWIDATFHNTTVLAYQSALGSSSALKFGKDPTNRLIVSSYFSRSLPTPLVRRLAEVRKKWPEVFVREDSGFFVRRCLVAVDLATRVLGELRSHQLADATHRSQRLGAVFARYRDSDVDSRIGRLHFNAEGEETSQNHFVLYQAQMVSANPRQVSATHEMIDTIQFGFQDFRISSVKVEANKFKTDFYFWLRHPIDPAKTAAGTNGNGELELQFVGYDPESFHQRLVASHRIGKTEDRLYQVSGLFNKTLDGSWFPFDRQVLKIELRTTRPSSELRVSPDSYNLLNIGAVEQAVDGWTIDASYIAVDNMTTQKIPISTASDIASSEFSTVNMVVEVKRRLWSSLMLVFAPLSLMALASLAVLFMVVRDPSEQADHDPAETLKTQTELTLGCTLAVITYLVSYAALAPRLDAPIYSDYLLGATLLICVLNFVFVVAVSKRDKHRLLRILAHDRYRIAVSLLTLAVFGGWLAAGVCH